MADSSTYLKRMRANAHAALVDGATPDQVEAAVLAVTRPRLTADDAQELAEHAMTLSEIRSHQPGEVRTDA